MLKPLCNIKILETHEIGSVGGKLGPLFGRFIAQKGDKIVGSYEFETACGSLTCCLVSGEHVYFDAEKVRILTIEDRYFPQSAGGNCYWIGDLISRQPKVFYVVDSKTHERAVEGCVSWEHAEQEAQRLNQELTA